MHKLLKHKKAVTDSENGLQQQNSICKAELHINTYKCVCIHPYMPIIAHIAMK